MTSLAIATFVPGLLTSRGVSLAGAGLVVALYLTASGLGAFVGCSPTASVSRPH